MAKICVNDAEQEDAASRKGAVPSGAPLHKPDVKLDTEMPQDARVATALKHSKNKD